MTLLEGQLHAMAYVPLSRSFALIMIDALRRLIVATSRLTAPLLVSGQSCSETARNGHFDRKKSASFEQRDIYSTCSLLHSVNLILFSPPGSPHPAHITSSQSPLSLSSPITASTFHSRLKTHLFHKSFSP